MGRDAHHNNEPRKSIEKHHRNKRNKPTKANDIINGTCLFYFLTCTILAVVTG
jgi:hypothetical protein